MADKSVGFTLMIEPELRKQFIQLAKSKDQSAAQVVRAFMRDYIKRNAQGSLPLKPEVKSDGS